MFLAACLSLMVWSAAGLSVVLRGRPAPVVARVYGVLAVSVAGLLTAAAPFLLSR